MRSSTYYIAHNSN